MGARRIFVRDLKRGETTLVSVNQTDGQAGSGLYPAPSEKGRVVAFLSIGTDLVAGDTNDAPDVFVRDVRRQITTRVSVSSAGVEADAGSGPPAISANGRIVAFVSAATNLVAGDTNATVDVFVHDRKTAETTRVSVASDGTEADGSSGAVALSATGRHVIFQSDATNLVPGDTNGEADIFVHDRRTGDTVRVSVDGTGGQSAGPAGFSFAIDRKGRFAAFGSTAADLVPDDTNGAQDVFVHDLKN